MATDKRIKDRIKHLKEQYDTLKEGKETLLVMLDEAEVPEAVYNSNAIENSTLTLKETEKILLDMEVSRNVSVREVFEAKNLARVIGYVRIKSQEKEIDKEIMLLLHQMLIGGINDSIAGRFRAKGEYVRVASHVAPTPEQVEALIAAIISEYGSDHGTYFADKIAKFHLELEHIHPFVDGNGRIGRVLINWQLVRLGFPRVIFRDKEKADYYRAFVEYKDKKNPKPMEKIVVLALMESLHKRLAYLKGENIIRLSDFTKQSGKAPSALLNAARRQTIPAFREKGAWKIAKDFKPKK